MEKKTNIATVILFWAALAVLSLGSLLKKDGLFSENENRSLTQRPSLSLTTVLDGSFQEELESYLQDQILFRDGWNALHSAALLAIGDCDINGAYVGEAGYDFEKITEADVDQKRFHTNTRAIRIFLERQQQNLGKGKVSFMLVPTAARLLPEMVPDGAPLFDQDRRMDELFGQLKGFRTVDLRKVFGEAADGKDLYYYTDHHWTTHGAYLAYASWRKNAPKESDYEVSVVSDRFRGSLYSKVLNENSPWDTVERFDLKGGEEAYTVFAGDDKLDGLYDETKLKEKDKYAYFLGGNVGLLTIQKQQADSDSHLLIIKDSFANAFTPFAAADYAKTSLIDLRYYTGDVNQYIADSRVTDVLVLYNISNFVSDRNIARLGR